MEKAGSDFANVTPKCLKDAGLDADQVTKCAQSKEGVAIQHKNAQLTAALSPKHEYVPWILINGKHDDNLQNQAQSNLEALVCSLLQDKPDACNDQSLM
jgi:interferon gamma-inducible protein 30